MSHRMFVSDGASGTNYVVELAQTPEGFWTAHFAVHASDGSVIRAAVAIEPVTPESFSTAYRAFRSSVQVIEYEYSHIAGCDWVFEEPLPPWLLEEG